jgi:hypothetical protein
LQRKTAQQREYRCLLSVRVLPFVQTKGSPRVVQNFEAAGGNQRRGIGTRPLPDFFAVSRTLPPDEPQIHGLTEEPIAR